MITNISMGVHTNMCVLGRPFGIRAMVGLGRNVVLVRDLIDGSNDGATSSGEAGDYVGADQARAHGKRVVPR